MRKINFKLLLMSTLLLLTFGGQSWAGQNVIKSVYLLNKNNIRFTTGDTSRVDTAHWLIRTNGTGPWEPITNSTGATLTTPTTTGAMQNSQLSLDGSYTGFSLSDSTTSNLYEIGVFISSPGGCFSDDTSVFMVRLLPYLPKMHIVWTDSGAICASNPVSKTLQVTKPSLTINGGAPLPVSVGDVTWYTPVGSTTPISSGVTQSGNTSELAFQTPGNTTPVGYEAQAAYSPLGADLIVSDNPLVTGNVDGHATSDVRTITAAPQPTAPTISGGSSVGGF